jgi:hypothetical protein
MVTTMLEKNDFFAPLKIKWKIETMRSIWNADNHLLSCRCHNQEKQNLCHHSLKNLKFYTINKSMERSPSWEASSCSYAQELSSLLWNPQIHCHVHRSLVSPRHGSPSGCRWTRRPPDSEGSCEYTVWQSSSGTDAMTVILLMPSIGDERD